MPVANPETADRLLNTAIDVTVDQVYRLVITHVIEVSPQVPLSEGDRFVDEDDREPSSTQRKWAEHATVPAEMRIRMARDVATGITGAANQYDVDTILMGWHGRPPRHDIVLGSYLDTVLRDVPCDVLVKRVRTPQSTVDSVLVPVASGPHAELATEIAGCIERQQDASVHLLYVLPFDPSESERELVGSVSEAVGRHAANTVILTQRHLSKTSRLKRLVR